mgnify:FL=1
MKSPLKYSENHISALPTIKKLVPEGSVVDSYLFYSGELEFALCNSKRFISAHTSKYVIYEFWQCALEDSFSLYEMVTSKQVSRIIDKSTFHILQENWPKYPDPYLRSALFFMLNRYSNSGLISSGDFNKKFFNPVSISYLRNFYVENFHLEHDSGKDICSIAKTIVGSGNYHLFPLGKFNYNLFDDGKSYGLEQYKINHRKLFDIIKEKNFKWIALYKPHAYVFSLYSKFNIKMTDKNGNLTTNKNNCEDIIVTNF